MLLGGPQEKKSLPGVHDEVIRWGGAGGRCGVEASAFVCVHLGTSLSRVFVDMAEQGSGLDQPPTASRRVS